MLKIITRKGGGGSSIASETTWRYQAYQTTFLTSILKTVISIRKDPGVEIDSEEIDDCHRLPLWRNSRRQDKRVIATFVNRKHSEALVRDKKRLSRKSFNHLNVSNKVFVSVSLCSHYRYIWGKCKDLQRQGQIR